MEPRWTLIADGLCPVHQTPLVHDDDPRYDRCDDCPAGWAITSESTFGRAIPGIAPVPGVQLYQLSGRPTPALDLDLPTTAVDVQIFTTQA